MSPWTIEQMTDAVDVWARKFSDCFVCNEELTGGDRDGVEQLREALAARSGRGVAGRTHTYLECDRSPAPVVSGGSATRAMRWHADNQCR